MMKKSLLFLFLATTTAQLQSEVDFDRQVKPILNSKCTSCHGGVKREGKISFLNRSMALKQGKSGDFAIVPGKPNESAMFHRISTNDESDRMPPEGAPLEPEEINILKEWIAQGADWPAHWAYQGYDKPELPKVQQANWIKNPIDAFVLDNLEKKEIKPSDQASKSTLIRRLYIDLLGLIPSPEQVQSFVEDQNPDAYEKLVDSLLRSPHFGERWGRHWLDQARFADTDGYEKDLPRPDAWRWRKWVIDAINNDMPYNQFTVEQIAGDLLNNRTQEQILATAFHRQTMFNREGGVNPEEDRNKRVMDRLSTVNKVWMGLTMECAQCHDHPYDPFTHKDFYSYMAFFNNSDEADEYLKLPHYEKNMAKAKELEEKRKNLDKQKLEQAFAEWTKTAPTKGAEYNKFSKNLKKLVKITPEKRNDKQKKDLYTYYLREINKDYKPLYQQAKQLREKATLKARVIKTRAKDTRDTFLYTRGDYLNPDKQLGPLKPTTMASLHSFKPAKPDQATRLDLAKWIVDPDNTLTARVFVNKVWSHLFGSAFVEPMDDFGVRASRPEHLNLLNYLATTFVENNWSRKALIRDIVLSSTYRQQSHHRKELETVDPENRLLARQNRYRVEAEIVRDLQLSCGDLLKHKLGGPSVFPPVAIDVDAQSYGSFKWKVSQNDDRYRRGMYTFFKRTAPDPNLMVFDCPDASVTAMQRGMSNTPLQALTTLNNEVFVEANQALAKRVMTMKAQNDEERIDKLFTICLSRTSDHFERVQLKRLLNESRDWYKNNPEAATKMTQHEKEFKGDLKELAAWATTTRVVMNLDEFFTRE
jgi:hypothetical protein